MSTLTVQPVTAVNWLAALDLDLFPHQRDFTPSVALSLAKAYIEPNGYCYDPFLVLVDRVPVGFYSYVHLPYDTSFCYLGGLLIDRAHQGKGYGRATVRHFIGWLGEHHPECSDLFLTVHPQNEVALRLYTSLGFIKTGMALDGEEEMRLVLQRMAGHR